MTRITHSNFQNSFTPVSTFGRAESSTTSQIHLDALFSSFTSQCTDASSIATMTLAGLTGRVARMGILSLGGGNLLSHFGSVAAEAGVMTGMNYIQNPPSPPFNKGGLGGFLHTFSSHFVNFGMFRLFHTNGHNPLAQHFVQSLAMMAGHHAAAWMQLEDHSQNTLLHEFFEANISNLQIRAGSVLSGRLTGGRLQRIEGNLEAVSAARLRPQAARPFLSALRTMRAAEESQEPAPTPLLEDLEGRPRDPARQLDEIKRELNSATLRFQSLVEAITDTHIQEGYTREFLSLSERISFWEIQQKAARRKKGRPQERFIEDILIGQRILHDDVLRLSTAMAVEPIQEHVLSEWGLRTQLNIFPKPERMPQFRDPAETRPTPPPGVTILEAAIAKDMGFGRDLALWHHQAEALNIIRATLRRLKGQFDRGEAPSLDNLQGNIGIPVGGGKTRLTMASFAAAIEANMFRLDSDKFLFFTHTDQIHKQNLDEVWRLNEYFKRRFGRDLRVTQYKADIKDLNGDLCLVSIPTAGTERGREGFRTDLLKALGRTSTQRGGEVVMGAVDEVHHLGMSGTSQEKIWLELMKTVREVSPFFFREGFSGSLTGKEGRRLYYRTERDLLQAGITPRRYLVPVEGIDLSGIRVSLTGELNTKQMQSTLLAHPERNQRLYERVERWGRRQETPAPSGRERFMGIIAFCDTLAHGQMMLRDFNQYFGQTGEGTRGRKIRTLGSEKGVITRPEMEAALRDYRAGRIDAIACLVSGKTRTIKMTLEDSSAGDMTDYILERANAGEIELVINDSALKEGADLHMFFNGLGARATFSTQVKRQEAGRTNRRTPGELGPNGELFRDPPRILFDVVDNYEDRTVNEKHGFRKDSTNTLIRYANVIGCLDPRKAKFGQLFDVLGDQVVEEIDLVGRVKRLSPEDYFRQQSTPAPVPPIIEPPAPEASPPTASGEATTSPRPSSAPPPPPPRPQQWRALTLFLRSVLEKQYGNNVQTLAKRLRESVEYVERLLQGEGWVLDPWYLRRLATLLYLDREVFYDLQRGAQVSETRTEPFPLLDSLAHDSLRDFTSLFPGWARKKGPLNGEQLLAAIREFAATRPQHAAFYELMIALYENAQLTSAGSRKNVNYFLEGRPGLEIAQVRTLQNELGGIVRRLLG